MIVGGLVEIVFGINAEGKSLEDITETAHRDRATGGPSLHRLTP